MREPPSTLVGAIVDNDIDWPRPTASLEHVANLLAAYNMVALPVVDENARLLGAVTIDDVLDHLLPEGWRESDPDDAQAGDGRGDVDVERREDHQAGDNDHRVAGKVCQ